jgi:hypothetical protein
MGGHGRRPGRVVGLSLLLAAAHLARAAATTFVTRAGLTRVGGANSGRYRAMPVHGQPSPMQLNRLLGDTWHGAATPWRRLAGGRQSCAQYRVTRAAHAGCCGLVLRWPAVDDHAM